MDVFNKIGAHPLLRKAVRELMYDTPTFRNPPNDDVYYDDQAAEMRLVASDWRETPFTYPDAEVESYIEDLKSSSYRRPGAGSPDGIYLKHKGDHFIRDGHRKYLAHAAYERQSVSGGKHYRDLCARLSSLPNLRSVVLTSAHWNHVGMEN